MSHPGPGWRSAPDVGATGVSGTRFVSCLMSMTLWMAVGRRAARTRCGVLGVKGGSLSMPNPVLQVLTRDAQGVVL